MKTSPINAMRKSQSKILPMKLWIYTNYDCNLSCLYCVAESTPRAPRRAMPLQTVIRIIDEAVDLGVEQIYFTGGEPFILDDIYAMLDYAAQHLPTTVLTNGMLLSKKRLDNLKAVMTDNLIIQISLDGSCPEQHDPFRGKGSWAKTVAGIKLLHENGFKLRISTTETAANTDRLDEICAYHTAMGIPEEDHIIRPLAKRGFSKIGLEVSKETLIPEITVNADGVYWHPLSTDADLKVQERIFPLVEAVEKIRAELDAIHSGSQDGLQTFQ